MPLASARSSHATLRRSRGCQPRRVVRGALGPVVTTPGDSVREVGYQRVTAEEPEGEIEVGAERYRFAWIWEWRPVGFVGSLSGDERRRCSRGLVEPQTSRPGHG